MEFLNLWQGRTGRISYLAALVISCAPIIVLPFIAGKIATAFAAGMDPGVAIARSLLRMWLLGIGFLITASPLLFFVRRRLREIGLSGVWLLLFPIGPLKMLFFFAIASTSLGVWPLPLASPITGLPFWLALAFGALLAVVPSGDYLEHSPKRILRFVHFATTGEGRISRPTFVLHLAIALGLTLLTGVLGIFGLMPALARPGGQSMSMVAGAVVLAGELLTVSAMMFVTASTIRRLHDLNQKAWWIILFPLGLPSLFSLSALANPLSLISLLNNPFMALLIALSIAQGLGCLILLVWLLSKRGSEFDNSHDLSVSPPNLNVSSA
jgi:uncharacterized membrane protein YhaH (DUF805 family)